MVVACSGGADSLALLSAAVFEGHRLGHHVVGVTVDHGLQEGSADHAAQVVDQMAALGADETVSARVAVDAGGCGPEAAAREARYAVLDEVAAALRGRRVLLGHTLDDQAETVLLGLARGSGGRSLSGMRARVRVYRRPLLDVARADTVTACQVEGLETWGDPHNDDPRFLRVRVRRRVLPVLEEELGPGRRRHPGADRRPAARRHGPLDDLAAGALANVRDPRCRSRPWRRPTAVRRRVLRLAALEAGAPPASSSRHVCRRALVTAWRGQRG